MVLLCDSQSPKVLYIDNYVLELADAITSQVRAKCRTETNLKCLCIQGSHKYIKTTKLEMLTKF